MNFWVFQEWEIFGSKNGELQNFHKICSLGYCVFIYFLMTCIPKEVKKTGFSFFRTILINLKKPLLQIFKYKIETFHFSCFLALFYPIVVLLQLVVYCYSSIGLLVHGSCVFINFKFCKTKASSLKLYIIFYVASYIMEIQHIWGFQKTQKVSRLWHIQKRSDSWKTAGVVKLSYLYPFFPNSCLEYG